ncbi:hypothetical protein P4O66_014652 [Electrophorus voltai]|uniref:Immunoglobulin V-set domain-containing protein n=1 Tax=Electrophorus voltai TaxID=2609070 RepID=A0AAD9DQX7_9TELE|nr:hypothetical protein P4O66_014652 [Electrophorus voltai]
MATQLPNSTDFTTFYWRFRSELNSSVNIVTYMQTYVDTVVSEVYEDRVEISKETFSLTLKKLRKTDSGIYTAEASGLKVTDITRYNLTVLGPKMFPLQEKEDIEHYLTTFERIAHACRWPYEDWTLHLIPLMSGKA